jgi:hypothetical protein
MNMLVIAMLIFVGQQRFTLTPQNEFTHHPMRYYRSIGPY